MKIHWIAIGAVLGLMSLGAEPPPPKPPPTASQQLQEIQDGLRQAHAGNDAAAYVSYARKMRDLLNGSPDSILQLMLAESFAGNAREALQCFSHYLRLGQSNPAVLQSRQLDAIRGRPEFAALVARMADNRGMISAGTKAFDFTDKELLPEDIDYDSTTKCFYLTSILHHELLAVDLSGHARIFAPAPDRWPMVAVKVDSRRRLLWATEVAFDGLDLTPAQDWGHSAILLYDLDTGRLRRRIPGPEPSGLGDMTLTDDGDAIVSDGDRGGVYRVRLATGSIERLDAGDFISPQTPALHPDGRHIFVPDYTRGIGVLDLQTRQVAWMNTEGTHALSGIDGLYLRGRTLVAVQNGTAPERVIVFHLDASLSRIESESIVERATPTLGVPTHGVFLGGDFYYIANSGWNVLDEHGRRKPGAAFSPACIRRAQLNSE
ncbi:MAG: hypothetical protein ACHQ5A_06535 [Opitutales bacterium]